MANALNNSPYKSPESFLKSASIQGTAVQSGDSWLIARGLLLLLSCLFQIGSLSLLVLLCKKWLAGQLYPSLLLQLALFTLLALANISCLVLIYSTVRRRMRLSIVSGSGCCFAALCLYLMMIISSL